MNLTGPLMYPWKTILQFDKRDSQPVYLQIAQAIVQEINHGRIRTGQKMPGTRALAQLLGINRKTLSMAYDELMAQDWLEIIPYKGTFVSKRLPQVRSRSLTREKGSEKNSSHTDFESLWPQSVPAMPTMETPSDPKILVVDGGAPDERLAPMDLIYKKCRSISHLRTRDYLSYSHVEGSVHLREVLPSYLSSTRGLTCGTSSLLITRGSQMAIYLIFQQLLVSGGAVMVGSTNYPEADDVILHAGGSLLKIPVDQEGIQIEPIAAHCQREKVKAIYITPHHHYPTTVTLSAKRRLQLLELAQRHRFFIIEDDYDYDFHYKSSPILPLASMDTVGCVIYIGAFSKLLAPVVRVGYMVCSPRIISEMSRLRQIIDRQGDAVMEKAIAEMIEEGELQRHLKKTVKTYRHRRDFICTLFRERLGTYFDFEVPDGGMAIWLRAKPFVPLKEVLRQLPNYGVYIRADRNFPEYHNAVRLGFASLNEGETNRLVESLSKILKNYSKQD